MERTATAPAAPAALCAPTASPSPRVAGVPGGAGEVFVFEFRVRCRTDAEAETLAQATTVAVDADAERHGSAVIGGLTWQRAA